MLGSRHSLTIPNPDSTVVLSYTVSVIPILGRFTHQAKKQAAFQFTSMPSVPLYIPLMFYRLSITLLRHSQHQSPALRP